SHWDSCRRLRRQSEDGGVVQREPSVRRGDADGDVAATSLCTLHVRPGLRVLGVHASPGRTATRLDTREQTRAEARRLSVDLDARRVLPLPEAVDQGRAQNVPER